MLASFNRAALAILAGVAASPFVAISPASAQTQVVIRGTLPAGTQMRMVSFGDLNLNLIAHRKILNERVTGAVREVCHYRSRDEMNEEYRNCADRSWAGARPQINRAYARAYRLAYAYRRRY